MNEFSWEKWLSETGYFGNHNHTEYSNLRLKDCNMKVGALIEQAQKLGLKGISITDHECISGHIDAIIKSKELQDKGIDFKVALGNEIYLVNSLSEVRDNYQPGITKFPHFVLTAKNKEGHLALRKLSSVAWGNLFRTGKMERVCVETSTLASIMAEHKGTVIASSACLGGYIGIKFLQYYNTNDATTLDDIEQFLNGCKIVFGEDFYLELQPSFSEEQIVYNKFLISLSSKHNIKLIYTTDSHYLSKDHREVHKAFLLSKEGERELDDFYASTYVMSTKEVWEYFKDYISKELFIEMTNNSLEILDKIDFFDLYHEVVVPQVTIPPFSQDHCLSSKNYEYIQNFATSEHLIDRYFLFEIAQGLKLKHQELNEQNLSRIDLELKEIWLISKKLNQQLSSYYVLTKDVVDLMWELSLVGVARGSVTGYYITYLTGIIQMNPLKYGLHHWRHLTSTRPELPDIDIDSEADKRQQIFTALKEKYGYHKVLNIATFKTEKAKSAILTAGRGLGYNDDEMQALADMVPVARGAQWTLNECLNGDGEEKEPNKQFKDIIESYPNLLETALGIEGLVVGRSIHASGLYIFSNHYIEQNALMKAPNGNDITCWNMTNSDYAGALKIDCLTIEALDRIRACIELLLSEGKIQWKGSLRETYNFYLHPDNLRFNDDEMWDMLYRGDVINAFQDETLVGQQALKKINPRSFIEIVNGNSLMRLSSDGEQPLDRYVRFKQDLSQWYKEMRDDYKLNEDEIQVLEKYLKPIYGVADTQEVVMELSMEPGIADFDLTEANKLRKGIAKKKKSVIEEVKKLFFEKGLSKGNRLEILNYVWERQIVPQLGYSFSSNHTHPYSMILMQEMNLAYIYGHMYWKCACLSINAGAIGEGKNVDYGKIAKAVSEMQNIVDKPNINHSNSEFTILNDKILFGLRGISKVGDGVINDIIQNRPYLDFDDYLERVGKHIKVESNVNLIKSGAFDDFGDRVELMKKYIQYSSKAINKLTSAHIPLLIELELIDTNELKRELEYINIYKNICSKGNVAIQGKSDSTTWYKIDNAILDKFEEYYCIQGLKIDKDYILDDSGQYYIVRKSRMKKVLDANIVKLTETLKDHNILQVLNRISCYEMWEKYCVGTISHWEMDSMSFYKTEHELSNVDVTRYKIEDFYNLPEDPVVFETINFKGREFNRYKLSLIMGTVLSRNKDKHLVTILTPTGVVNCKFYEGAFRYYDKTISTIGDNGKKTRIESSWFKKGTLLLMYGVRMGDQFKPKKYSNSTYQHTVMKINNITADGKLIIQEERKTV